MKVHLLNGGTLRPTTGGCFPTQCLLIEHEDGLLLVDAGMSTAHIADPRMIGFERHFIRPPIDTQIAIVNQVKHLGFDPTDVQDIVLTHLHSEHATGIMDFPHARIHVSRAEHDSAMSGSLRSKIIYRQNAFAHGPNWVLHSGGGTWKGVGGTSEIRPGIMFVPTPGHTDGHQAVAVDLGGSWLLHAGDSAYGDLANTSTPEVFPLRQYQWVAATNRKKLRHSRRLITRLFEMPDVIPLCSHLPFSVAGNPVLIENGLGPRPVDA
jgi:glyoxylase-like metal-dependent hydrolase (beta-lactamase superfamily II)